MKKKLFATAGVLVAALVVAVYASSGVGCCAIPQQMAVAADGSSDVVKLHIEGMSCGACAASVKRVLTRIDGVIGADVSYQNKSAVVSYDASRVTPEKMVRTLEEKLPTYKARVEGE